MSPAGSKEHLLAVITGHIGIRNVVLDRLYGFLMGQHRP
jgi:hypothetical protein